MNGITKTQAGSFAVMSVLPADQVIVAFSIVGIYQSADVLAILNFGPLHDISLVVTRLRKECIRKISGNEGRETRTIKSGFGSNQNFKAVKLAILSAFNMFLTDRQIRILGTDVRVVLKIFGYSNQLTGLFTKSGLTGLLEEADYGPINKEFFSLVAIVDDCCCHDLSAASIDVCTKYVDRVGHIY